MDARTVRVGVALPRAPDSLGEWLADAGAFEAAGADALWVDPAPESQLDPIALLAALAAITSRALLVAALTTADRRAAASVRAIATVGRLSHGRLALVADPEEPGSPEEAGRLEGPITLAPGLAVFHRLPGAAGAFERRGEGGEAERWIQTPPPDGRAAWRAALAAAAERGAGGVIVSAGPRLLDILRNPNDPGERHDLQLAQG